MIYSVDVSLYPNEGQFIEEIIYKDENEFEWRIARTNNGFMIRYFGDPYFKGNIFRCESPKGELIRIKNTGCIFFKDADFETFCEVRNTLKNGWTDEIWETFEDLFNERIKYDEGLLESEII